MKKLTTKAIVLRRVNYGEADRILTVITPEQGKVSLFAKGARRAKSKLAGGLELFCVSDIDYVDSTNDLKTVVSTRLDQHFIAIVNDVTTTMAAYEFVKLIDEHTQESCDGHFFELLRHALAALAEQSNLALTKAWFYTQLLDLTGRSVNLMQQIDGTQFAEGKKYSFDFDHMGFASNKSGQYTPKHIKFLRLVSKVESPSHLLKVEDISDLASDLAPTLNQCLMSN